MKSGTPPDQFDHERIPGHGCKSLGKKDNLLGRVGGLDDAELPQRFDHGNLEIDINILQPSSIMVRTNMSLSLSRRIA